MRTLTLAIMLFPVVALGAAEAADARDERPELDGVQEAGAGAGSIRCSSRWGRCSSTASSTAAPTTPAPIALARALADDVNALIAPHIPYGVTGDMAPYPGALHVPEEVFRNYVHAVLDGMAQERVPPHHRAQRARRPRRQRSCRRCCARCGSSTACRRS